MAEEQLPFADVQVLDEGFSIPDLKWREILFVGALRPDGDAFVRDPSRPLPPFRLPDLFPVGVRFRVTRHAGRAMIRPARSGRAPGL
jgi:hypothetical protein